MMSRRRSSSIRLAEWPGRGRNPLVLAAVTAAHGGAVALMLLCSIDVGQPVEAVPGLTAFDVEPAVMPQLRTPTTAVSPPTGATRTVERKVPPAPVTPPTATPNIVLPALFGTPPTVTVAEVMPTVIGASPQAAVMSVTRAERSGSVVPPASTPMSGRSDYPARVSAWLERHKRFPPELMRNGGESTVVIGFTIDRSGRAGALRLVAGSGIAWLDRLALRQVEDASPFPRPPAGLSASDRVFEVPLHYRRRGDG